jgi:hypothetical protein
VKSPCLWAIASTYFSGNAPKPLDACDSPHQTGAAASDGGKRAGTFSKFLTNRGVTIFRSPSSCYYLHPPPTTSAITTFLLPSHHPSVPFQYAQRIFHGLFLQLFLHVRLFIATAVTPTAVHSLLSTLRHQHQLDINRLHDICSTWLTRST